MIAAKIKAALKEGITPLLCIGESAQERQKQNLKIVLYRQLKACLTEVGRGRIENVVICYEPVWAISANGHQRLPTINEIMEAGVIIRKFLTEEYGERRAKNTAVIYGGSVNATNARVVSTEANLDGVLVGKASTSPFELIKILQQTEENN
jgi:triosephosphate isomerase